VIDRCEYGTVAFPGEGGEPYCIPLSLVRMGDALFFHCARQGHKLELLRGGGRVCVSFVTDALPVYIAPQNNYTTAYKSAVVTGPAQEVTDPAQKTAALRALCEKLLPDHMEGFDRAIDRTLEVTSVWKISMESAVGKERAMP